MTEKQWWCCRAEYGKHETTCKNFALLLAAENMDWIQPGAKWAPCFYVDDTDGYFCGRSPEWPGHDKLHRYVSLADMLRSIVNTVCTERKKP